MMMMMVMTITDKMSSLDLPLLLTRMPSPATDIAAALLTYTQLSVYSRVERSVRSYTSIVPPKMNLRVYICCTD